MKHLTMKDYLDLCNLQDAPYPAEIQEHLETCDRCAAIHNIVFAPASREEPDDSVGDSCALCDDVYELFRNRLPPDRFIPLMYHLLQCEDCDGFFDLLLKREAPTSQARLAQEWLDAAGRALEDAGCPGAEIITCQLTNVYAQAASGDDIVIETTGHLQNGAEFSLKYDPERTVFRVNTASIGQTRLRRRVDDRWIEGWSETEGRQSGCSFSSSDVGYLHISEPDDAVGKTIETMTYPILKKVLGDKHVC